MILFTLLTDKLTTLSQNNGSVMRLLSICFNFTFFFLFKKERKKKTFGGNMCNYGFAMKKRQRNQYVLIINHFDICGELKQMYLYRE